MSGANLTLVVQAIKVAWTKEARGGPLAAPRNRVPEISPLPFEKTSPGPASPLYIRHEIAWDESNQFQKPLTDKLEITEFSGPVKNHLLGFYPEGEAIKVGFEKSYGLRPQGNVLLDYTRLGAPARTVPQEIFTLGPDEWGQVRYNGRFSWNSGWKYEKWVFNIVVFAGKIPAGPFQGSPTREYTSLADLY
ncbi:MAG: hypothetical protein J0I20_15650 [Chloroflexi bacterium]|nr:hypothetical protein [Chloroflexota bacterium]OJV91260.1 MAG: hypothetical protein BGO39_26810 [Chloroflexi bacterium 54-19]